MMLPEEIHLIVEEIADIQVTSLLDVNSTTVLAMLASAALLTPLEPDCSTLLNDSGPEITRACTGTKLKCVAEEALLDVTEFVEVVEFKQVSAGRFLSWQLKGRLDCKRRLFSTNVS